MPPPPPLNPPKESTAAAATARIKQHQQQPPRTEAGRLKLKSIKATEESLESTRRMVALCEESKEAGIKTLVALDDQGEQLDHIEQGMIQINEDMREAEKNLGGMMKCCGLLPCHKSSDFKEKASTWKGNDDGKIVDSQPQRQLGDTGTMVTYGGFIGRITSDAREDEMEANMSQVSTIVGNLRNMAIDIGGEIETQNRQLVRIDAKTQSNEERIKKANEIANTLIKT